MIHTSLLARNPSIGTTTYWHYDDVTGECHVETMSAVGPMMERNQEQFKAWNDYSRMGDLVKMGSLTLKKYFSLQKLGVIDDDPQQKSFMRWCRNNYAEYSKWFTAPKKVLF